MAVTNIFKYLLFCSALALTLSEGVVQNGTSPFRREPNLSIRETERFTVPSVSVAAGSYPSEASRSTVEPPLLTVHRAIPSSSTRPILYREEVLKEGEEDASAESKFCTWSHWGPCSATCDYGVQYRRMVSSDNGSVECQFEQGEQETVCMQTPCPLDCLFDETWTAWTECTVPCGGGSRYRLRLITRQAMFGGVPCPETDLTETEPCNSDACAYECRIEGTWSAWSECKEQNAVLLQTRDIPFAPAVKANRSGPNTTCDETAQYRLCSADASASLPPYECLQTEWSSWSPCTVSCGSGTQSRTRKILIPSVGSAPQCGPTYESQTCNMINCLESNIAALCSRRRNTYIPLGTCSAEYIYCTPGAVAVFSTCPQGQIFSTSVGLCAKLETIPECAALTRTENSCQGRSNGLYPLCSCCPQYMVCWESVGITRNCGAGQVFSSVPYGRCVDRAQTTCS